MLTLLDVKARRILGIFDKNTPELQMKKLEIKESFTERKKKGKKKQGRKAKGELCETEGKSRGVLKARNDATALKASQALRLSDGPYRQAGTCVLRHMQPTFRDTPDRNISPSIPRTPVDHQRLHPIQTYLRRNGRKVQ